MMQQLIMLRLMLHGERLWSATDESMTMRARDALICQSLLLGRSVIVDDTNLEAYHEAALRALAAPSASARWLSGKEADETR